MQTHTIRWNSNQKTLRIITFTEEFLQLLCKSEEISVSVVRYKLKKSLEAMTGNKHEYDYDQMEYLKKVFPNIQAISKMKSPMFQKVYDLYLMGVERKTYTFDIVELLETTNYLFRNLN